MTDQSANDLFHASSFMQGHNAEYLEQLYARYANDPNAVDAAWQEFFRQMGDADLDVKKEAAGPSWARADWPPIPSDELTCALDGQWPAPPPAESKQVGIKIVAKAEEQGIEVTNGAIQRAVLDSIRALMIIRAHRIRGHLAADLDPLGLREETARPELDPKTYGFTDADLDRPIFIDNVLGLEIASMRQIVEILKRTYCGTFALQYMHISDPEQSSWLKERIEGYGKEIQFTREGRKAILNKMVEAEGFEKFLHVKYMGTKRFGLDGGESLIPAMEQIIKRGGALGVRDIVIGMPHRGRLSVLANVMGKPYPAIFNEFQGGSFKPDDVDGSGDVKYHLGASSDREFDGNTVHLSLTANPSHLEAVNPVVLGKVRAKQEQLGDKDRSQVLPILLHGDAAFAGQGVVAECFGLSGLVGHKTGGTMHIVVNNQLGFTTAFQEAISSLAKCQLPVIAAVHGYCLGAGIDLITACDVRISAADGQFGVRETRIGLVADVGTLQRLPKIISAGHMAELAYTGKDISAARAEKIGLVNDVYDDFDSTYAAAMEMANTIAANPPLAVRGTKFILQQSEDLTTEQSLLLNGLFTLMTSLKSNDRHETMHAFGEKRPPVYTGS